MENITNYINEQLITEAKGFTLKDCPGWSFSFIKSKDRWSAPGEPKMKFSLVCKSNDKTKDIVVFQNFAYYHGGYDQGHYSERKFYLETITSGGRGNGQGRDREYEPMDFDLELDAEHLDCYLNGKKDWSKRAAEALEKSAMTFNSKTKLSEIKQKIERGW